MEQLNDKTVKYNCPKCGSEVTITFGIRANEFVGRYCACPICQYPQEIHEGKLITKKRSDPS